MATPFTKNFYARWGDMDFNAHFRNTAYLDVGGDVRMLYFSENGFPMSEFERLRMGPVIMRDEVDYFRELRLLEPFTVNLVMAGKSEDGSRFLLRNEFFRADGKRIAQVTSLGGWLDLTTRKLTLPPEKLMELIQSLVKTEDFRILESGIRR